MHRLAITLSACALSCAAPSPPASVHIEPVGVVAALPDASCHLSEFDKEDRAFAMALHYQVLQLTGEKEYIPELERINGAARMTPCRIWRCSASTQSTCQVLLCSLSTLASPIDARG